MSAEVVAGRKRHQVEESSGNQEISGNNGCKVFLYAITLISLIGAALCIGNVIPHIGINEKVISGLLALTLCFVSVLTCMNKEERKSEPTDADLENSEEALQGGVPPSDSTSERSKRGHPSHVRWRDDTDFSSRERGTASLTQSPTAETALADSPLAATAATAATVPPSPPVELRRVTPLPMPEPPPSIAVAAPTPHHSPTLRPQGETQSPRPSPTVESIAAGATAAPGPHAKEPSTSGATMGGVPSVAVRLPPIPPPPTSVAVAAPPPSAAGAATPSSTAVGAAPAYHRPCPPPGPPPSGSRLPPRIPPPLPQGLPATPKSSPSSSSSGADLGSASDTSSELANLSRDSSSRQKLILTPAQRAQVQRAKTEGRFIGMGSEQPKK